MVRRFGCSTGTQDDKCEQQGFYLAPKTTADFDGGFPQGKMNTTLFAY